MSTTQLQNISNFVDLIYPMQLQKFKQDFWEKQHLIIQRQDTDYYRSLISIEDFDKILDLHRPTGASLRVVKNQEPMPANRYENPDGSLNLNQLYAAYADGYTLVVNEVNRYWEPLRHFCQNMQSQFNCKVVANMYLTPKHQKALLPHYDTHDVYVLQIHGKKHWKLYDADYETPILGSFQPIFQREQLRNEQDLTVEAGDLLYVPRGVPHEAVTTEESSLHLTIGIYPTQWMDVLTKAIQQLAPTNIDLRKALPMGYLQELTENPESLHDMERQFKQLLKDSIDKADIRTTLGLIAEEFRMSQRTVADGHFASLDQVEDISIDTILTLRSGMNRVAAQNNNGAARIIYPGNVIKGPAQIYPCFEFVANQKTEFKVSGIPLVNEANKIKIAQRLVRGGLLKIVAPS